MLFCFVIIVFAIVACLTLFQSFLNEPDVASKLVVASTNYSPYLTGVLTIICIDVSTLIYLHLLIVQLKSNHHFSTRLWIAFSG